MQGFLEKLDKILLLKNTIIKPSQYNALVEYINGLLRDYCEFYDKRYSLISNTIRLLYLCNENKTCVHVTIKPTPITPEYDKLEVSYIIEGGKCEW